MEKTKSTKNNPKRVMSPKGRVSFPHLDKPHSFEDQEPKFSLTLLFPKKTNLEKMEAAATAAAVEKWGKKADGKWPKNMKWPFRKGSEKPDLEGYEDCIFVSATSKQRPQVVDQGVNRLEPEEIPAVIYAGSYARMSIQAFAYDKAGNRGVAFSLQNVQKLADGESFSGRKNAEDEFEAVDDEGSNDKKNYSDDDDDEDSGSDEDSNDLI